MGKLTHLRSRISRENRWFILWWTLTVWDKSNYLGSCWMMNCSLYSVGYLSSRLNSAPPPTPSDHCTNHHFFTYLSPSSYIRFVPSCNLKNIVNSQVKLWLVRLSFSWILLVGPILIKLYYFPYLFIYIIDPCCYAVIYGSMEVKTYL